MPNEFEEEFEHDHSDVRELANSHASSGL